MLKTFIFRSAALLALSPAFLLTGTFQSTFAAEAQSFSRNLMLEKQVELDSKTVATKVLRVKLPVGFTTPKHTHEGPGPRYVSKGKLKVIEGDKQHVFSAGQVFWETGQLMSVENVGDTEAELIIFEMAPGH